MSCRCELAIRIFLSKYPTIISCTCFMIRDCSCVSQMNILSYTVTHDTSIQTPQSLIARNDRQSSILYLLQNVIFAVGLMNFGNMSELVNRSFIIIHMKVLISFCQNVSFTRLGFYSQIIIAGIMPSTDSYIRNVISRLIFRQGGRTLHISVNMIQI